MTEAGLKAKEFQRNKKSAGKKSCEFGPPTEKDCRDAIADRKCPAKEKNERGDIPCPIA